MLLFLLSLAWADPKDDARRHFMAGLDAAGQGDYQTALDEFLKAQAVYPHPSTLYNIARSYADLGDLQNALAYYQLYRDAAPEKAADIDPVIAVLQARLRQQQPAEGGAASGAASSSAAISSSEAARLAAIAEELATLSRALAERGESASEAPAGTPTGTPAETTPITPLPETDLLGDAYTREVITASRYGQEPLDSPSTVTILTADDIRLSGATNIPDLLRRVTGVEVMSLAAAQTEVSIRGFNRELSNKVLVLVDGRTVYYDFLGMVLWNSLPISLEEIERIEIIRGPGSAVYGANAMTGVINILTRTPGEGKSVLTADMGVPDYHQGTALLSGRKENVAWRFSTGLHGTGRWTETGTADLETVQTWVPTPDQSLDHYRANGRVDIALPADVLLSLSGGFNDGYLEFYTLGALGNYGLTYTHAYGRADIGTESLHLRAFYNYTDGETGPWVNYTGERSLYTNLDTDVFDVEGEYLGGFTTGEVEHRINVGASYRFKGVNSGYFIEQPITEHHAAVFFQEQAGFDKLSLVGSLRLDRHPLVDLSRTLSPRLAAILRVQPRTSLRLTGGTSFRSPTFLESYNDVELPSDIDGIYLLTEGNTELFPERILTAEAGLHDESSRFHTADLAVYYNRVTDLIYLSDVEPALTFYDDVQEGFLVGSTQMVNLDPVYQGMGVELDSRFFPVDGLDLYFNANWERILEDDGAEVVRDASTSTWKINAGVMYRSPWRLDWALHVHYLSPQTWRLREFDAEGALIINAEDVPARLIPTAKVVFHPYEDDRLEFAGTVWNPQGFSSSRFIEHPKGQPVGGRAFGTVSWRF